jgi:phospholipase D1/2
VLLVGGFLTVRLTPLGEYLHQDRLAETLTQFQETWWAPLALLGLFAVLCPLGLPATPLLFAGGFVFGLGMGSLYNYVGCWLGAAASFGLGRVLGRDMVHQLLGAKLQRVEDLLERAGFLGLVGVRFMPIPFPVVNYGAAMTSLSAARFLSATALGLAPAVAIYTWFSSAIAAAAGGERGPLMIKLGLALAALFLLTFLPPWILATRRRRQERHASCASPPS